MTKTYISEMLSELGIIEKKVIKKANITDEIKSEVARDIDGNYCLYDNKGLSEDEIKLAILLKQVLFIKTIKNLVLFFVLFYIICFIISISI